jgi:subtilisin-like proprotein convertase family protein
MSGEKADAGLAMSKRVPGGNEMHGRTKRITTAAVAAIASISVATAIAATKERTFSTGAISVGIGGAQSASKSLKVKPKGKIKDVNVVVGFDTNQNSDYTFLLRHPSGKIVHLSSGNGGSGSGYGSGGCNSAATFDDDVNNDITDTEGVDTLLSETYNTEEWFHVTQSGGLDKLDGLKVNGRWQLLFTSTEETGAGDLECFEIEATYKTPNN